MKKSVLLSLSIAAGVLLSACSAPGNNQAIAAQPTTTMPAESTVPVESTTIGTAETSEANILIAYFTMPEPDGVDAVAGASRVIVDGDLMGNVEYVAQTIQKTAGGDLFAIRTVQDYPEAHSALVNFASEEKDAAARPELETHIENLDKYDVIFIGYPNWWGDLPMPLYTFLEEYDFSGKTVIPFNVHGGSRFSNTISTIAQYQPGADVRTDGFTVSRDSVSEAGADVVSWVQSLGL